MTAAASTGITEGDLARRDRAVVLLATGVLITLSWVVLARQHAAAGAGYGLLVPQAPLHGSSNAVLVFSMWAVMMVAMMLPPVLPWILLFEATSRDRESQGQRFVSTGLFVTGYSTIWGLYAGAASLIQVLVQHQTVGRALEPRVASAIGGAILVVAGLFQLTPLKSMCLKHCRTPFGFFLSAWRDGPMGSFAMGFRHGTYCLGCCWALMALAFVVGVMNVLWMAILTVVLCVEKIAPGGARLSRLFGVALAAWGIWLLA